MKHAVFLLALFAVGMVNACSTRPERSASNESAVAGVPIGQIRGLEDISSTLRTRLLADDDASTASFDVSRVAGPVFKMRKQLGVFALQGTTSAYQGGLATPLRITLWQQIFGRTAAAIGNVCAGQAPTVTFPEYADGDDGAQIGSRTFALDPSAYAKISAACNDHGTAAAGDLFDAVMGYGGTLVPERDAFLATFAGDGSPELTLPASQRVSDMVLALLLNPHFLLAK